MPAERRYDIDDLLRVMQRLRDPDHGCPWDVAQDFRSIVPSTIEECYELAAAIEHADFPHVAEELGDVLFQVVFYSQLGSEQDHFDFAEVVHGLVDKLLRRHPHVFHAGEIEGVVTVPSSVDSVRENWESIKQQERAQRRQGGTLADIPLALNALSRAQKMQERAAQVGFDWDDISGVVDKVEEELREFVGALDEETERQEDEIGDLLFSCVNLARHAGIDAEAALRRATSRFEGRFSRMEATLRAQGKSLVNTQAEELDAHWRLAKRGDPG